MKTFKNNQGEEYLFIEVHEDAYDYRYKIMPDDTKQLVATIKDERGNIGTCYINENPIAEIISITKDITEEQRFQIIDEHPNSEEYWKFAMMPLFIIYAIKQLIGKHTKFKNGTENDELSFQSLLTSLRLNINNNYLILKKICHEKQQ